MGDLVIPTPEMTPEERQGAIDRNMATVMGWSAKASRKSPPKKYDDNFVGWSKGEKPKKRNNPEGQIQAACLELLTLKKVFHFRVNNLPVPIKDHAGCIVGFRPVKKKGIPDTLAIVDGRFIGIEFKSEDGRQSEFQVIFQKECEAAGGLYWLIRSVDELDEKLKAIANARN